MEDEQLEEHALALGGTRPALMPYIGMPWWDFCWFLMAAVEAMTSASLGPVDPDRDRLPVQPSPVSEGLQRRPLFPVLVQYLGPPHGRQRIRWIVHPSAR